MTAELSHLDLESADGCWQDIEQLFEDIAALARTPLALHEFHRGLLDCLAGGLKAAAGAVWRPGAGGQLRLEYRLNLPEAGLPDAPVLQASHRQLVDSVLRSGTPQAAPPHSGSDGSSSPGNPTGYTAVLGPLRSEGEAAGVIELFFEPAMTAAAQRICLQVLDSIGEYTDEYYRRQELEELRAGRQDWARIAELSKRVHADLDLQATSYRIANEGRPFVGCDRLCVLVRRRFQCELSAVSGAHTFDRRANLARRLERLIRVVMAAGGELYYDGTPQDLPPQIAGPLQEYLDESHARVLAVAPLRAPASAESGDAETRHAGRPSAAVGALVAESFQSPADSWRPRLNVLCDHSASAVSHALDFQSLPFHRVLRGVGRWIRSGRWPRAAGLIALPAIVAALLCLVPADFRIEARGQLQPVERREIFAPGDGVVSELLVRNEQSVAAGEVLAVLRNPELELEYKRTWGELQQARKKLAAVQAARGERGVGREQSPVRSTQLTAEEEELKERLSSLELQLEILQEQQAELTVRSPIGGRVLTWNVEQLLEARPVQRGQILMSVADPDGPWVAELQIPDNRVGHVLAARSAAGGDLKVSYILATDPGVTYEERMAAVSMSVERIDSDEPVVPATVNISPGSAAPLRPGATVVAKIDCGRRPLGYVWLHDLIDAVRTWLLF